MIQGQQFELPAGVLLPQVKLADWVDLWNPPERLPLAEWAEKYYHLAPPSKVTGLIQLYGWQKQIMNSFTDPHVRQITLMVSTQMIKTLFIQVAAAYAIACDPGPILIVQPKDDDAKNFVKERIRPMIEVNPVVAAKMYSDKKRTDDNTLQYMRFQGGLLAVVGAGSAGNLARREVRYLFRDEIDREGWDSDPVEGDKLAISTKRTSTYQSRSKIINTSSPTLVYRENSTNGRIHRLFLQSDQRYLQVKCPICDEPQVMDWANVTVRDDVPSDEQAQTARYRCIRCEKTWDDVMRWAAANAGVFHATKSAPWHAGFTISHLESWTTKLSDLVTEWGHVKRNPSEAKTFLNTALAKPVDDRQGDTPDHEVLYGRREDYPANESAVVPARGLFLTCGVDVQKDRLEYEVTAWGRHGENWSMAYGVIRITDEAGNVAPASDPRLWAELEEKVLNRTWDHENTHSMPIQVMCIDHGHLGAVVDNFVRRHRQVVVTAGVPRVIHPRTVVAVRGSTSDDKRIIGTTSIDSARGRAGAYLVTVSTFMIKDELYQALRLPRAEGDRPTPGYCHFPTAYELPYFQGLCSERRVERASGKVAYEKDGLVRNEPLDTRVYSRAGYSLVGAEQFSDAYWAQLERVFGPITREHPMPVQAPAPVAHSANSAEAQVSVAVSKGRKVRYRFNG